MHISKIELENIKSHASSTFEFGRGTTAITGENGAGKTTIIEAIAWALFDLLEYKKDDFVRRGAKKGTVRVTFESGLDEREYVVYRDTGAGYHVTDPRLQTRIADKKEEVFRFLWQHLGLEPGTDLRSLFRQAIGVPQGTFTAIFLEGTTERKIAFDRLLKVEEYRQAAEKLRETSRFLDISVAAVREDIARSEGELTRAETITAEHQTYTAQVVSLSKELDRTASDLAARQQLVNDLNTAGEKFAGLQKDLARSRSEKEKAELVARQREEALRSAAEASQKLETVKEPAGRHIETLGRIKELERERGERDRIRGEIGKIDTAIANVKADRKRFADGLDAAGRASKEIAELAHAAQRQETLEKEIAAMRNTAAAARATAERVRGIDEKLVRLREAYKTNQAQLKQAEEKAAVAAELAVLESRTGELMQTLATLQANLERDEQFQSEIKNGLCPILSQKCLNLNEGETLEGFVSSQFVELRSQISGLESERLQVTVRLAAAREAARAAAALETLRDREREIAADGKMLGEEKEALSAQAAGLAEIEERLAAAEAGLTALHDPRSRISLLEREAGRETQLRSELSDVETNLARLERERSTLVEQLEAYRDLDEHWAHITAERDATADAYRVFLANESEAKSLDERQKQLEAAAAHFAAGDKESAAAETALAAAGASYDRERHDAERAALLDAERRYAETRANADTAKRREEQLAAEIARFAELRRSLQTELREKERLESVAETTAFIRDTLKEAAPRVARNYVYHVSIEANQMFREITGNAERTLKWTEDYSIVLEEDGYERPFQSLSGGEQMAAALSVRLTLLKQLTDIRIAFFDEPTTNLDMERRENLAMQISRITHFDQLFVISHDETFDSYVDHVIAVGG